MQMVTGSNRVVRPFHAGPGAFGRRASSRRTNLHITSATAQELNEKFGIKDHTLAYVSVEEGNGGLPKVVLRHPTGSSAEIYLFGATLTSWKQSTGDEVLFVRPDAKFDKSKGISGGIPHCFPQFGPGEMKQHGFARDSDWELVSTSADPQPDEQQPTAEFVLTNTPEIDAMWPYKFKVVYCVTVMGQNEIKTEFRVINEDDKPFDFQAALHSYFEVADIKSAKVIGLKGLKYLDKVADANNPAEKEEDRNIILFEGPVDSVYMGAPSTVCLDVGTQAGVQITSTGWEDVVVWSPWDAMPDSYEKFACVENVKYESVSVEPGSNWTATANFEVVCLD